MSKQETNKIETEHKSEISLGDLPVDDAQQDEVKGGNGLRSGPVVDILYSPK